MGAARAGGSRIEPEPEPDIAHEAEHARFIFALKIKDGHLSQEDPRRRLAQCDWEE